VKKLKLLPIILSIFMLFIPLCAHAQEAFNIRGEIARFDLSTMTQYAGADWQTDPNSSTNIIKKDQEAMEKSYKTSGSELSDAGYYSGGGDSEIDMTTILIAVGVTALLALVIVIPLNMVTE
jgi:hypothetical protein